MIERYIRFLGEDDTLKLLEANEQPLIPSIRVNTLKISIKNLKQRLEKKNFILNPTKWVPYGFEVLKSPLNLGSTHEYLHGYYYLQNIASMLPALILNPKPNDVVVDMCAAPGSKSTQLAQIMQNQGTLILIEKNLNRIPALEMNLRRIGVLNSIILNIDAIRLKKSSIKANKVLLDAPCTGEGLIREDPSRKKTKFMSDLKEMAKIQKELLIAGLTLLEPKGQLLYSTCSIAPEENEEIINDILYKNPNFKIKQITEKYGLNGLTYFNGIKFLKDLSFAQRIYPHIHNTIGFFLCLIERVK